MPRNRNKTKKPGQIFIWHDIPKMKTILIKFKIRISQLIAKILIKQRSLNEISQCLTGHNQI